MVRTHEYINISQTKSTSPHNKPTRRLVITDSTHSNESDSTTTEHSSNNTTPSTTPPQRQRSSYVNVQLVKTASPLLPPEPKTPLSPVPTDTSIWSSQFDEGGSPLSSSPPLPPRNYSESDTVFDSHTNSQTDGLRTDIASGSDTSSPLLLTKAPVKHTITTQGHEYAVIDRLGKDDDVPITRIVSLAPPVPLKARQRLAQDAQDAGLADVAPQTQNRIYAELEMPPDTFDPSSQNPKSPVAYAVVDLTNQTTTSLTDGRQEMTKLSKPHPYEVPTHSMENLTDPGYETVPEKQGGE